MKFEQLQDKDKKKKTNPRERKLQHEVVDLTNDGIDEDIKVFLKLGPDFSEAQRRPPYKKQRACAKS